MTLLAEDTRTARKPHPCGYCHRPIAPGSRYLDQRVADNGIVWTFRAHLDCHSAYWTWVDDSDDGSYPLADLSDGHLPPCWHAWNRDRWVSHYPFFERFIGPEPQCSCHAPTTESGATP